MSKAPSAAELKYRKEHPNCKQADVDAFLVKLAAQEKQAHKEHEHAKENKGEDHHGHH